MKKIFLITLTCLSANILNGNPFPQNQKELFPDSLNCKVQPYYKSRPDGKPGREIMVKFIGASLSANSELEVRCKGIREVIDIKADIKGLDSLAVLLPPEMGVRSNEKVTLVLRQGDRRQSHTLQVPALRHWTVFVYPHSHVDIGYSNTHENVEFIHKRNIDEGIKLAEKTKDYPEGSRYVWNPEVMWPIERYMNSANQEQGARVIEAVKRGYLSLDASYVHVNTSTLSEEEMFHLFKDRRDFEKLTGKPNDVLVQADIPGMSWGIVPVMVQEGVRFVMNLPNSTRGNGEKTYALNQKPFWWVGRDGKSRVLFMQPGSYAVGLGKGATTGRPWFGQQDPSKIPEVIRTSNPRENFLDNHLWSILPTLERTNHPYDYYVVTWALWDNALLDADLPDAVRSWNEDYAYPRLVIAGAHQILQTFEEKYGDQLPIVKGDYTEYWTDNMGVAAKENKMNRNAKERLLQAETAWSMLNQGRPAPRKDFDEAWRYILLGSEHTYAAENPKDPFFFNATWRVKQSYFREGTDRSITLLEKALAPATDRSTGALGPIEGPSNGGVAVINTHSWTHGGLITLNILESQPGDRVVDDQGNEVLAQRLSTGELVFLASDVPAFGSRHYRVVPGKCQLEGSPRISDHVIENGLLQVEVDKTTGNVIRLVDLASGQDYADAGADGGINTFRWQPGKGLGDVRPDNNIIVSIKESGPLVAELQVTSMAPGCRSVIRRIGLVHEQPWVEFTNTVDKLPLEAKDGIHFGFGFNVPGGRTLVDIPWSVMQVEEDQLPAANRAWMVTQHWLDISNAQKGVTWCSLDAPLFESGGITANNTASWDGLGDIWPSKLDQSSLIYSWVMNNHWFTNTPLTQDGPVSFRYRAMPHGSYDPVMANRFGLEQAQPLLHVLCDKNPLDREIVTIDTDRVFITILKSLEDGKSMILRLRSLSDRDEFVRLNWPARIPSSVVLCDQGEQGGKTEASNGITVPAMGMVTLRLEWKNQD